jgi:hypothetical protein
MIGEHQNFDVKYSEVFEGKMLVVTTKKKTYISYSHLPIIGELFMNKSLVIYIDVFEM